MIKNQRHQMIAQFQPRTAIFNADESIKILEQFQWNCLEATSYVLDNVESAKQKSLNSSRKFIQQDLSIGQSLIPDECLNESEGVRYFEHAFQDRHPNIHRWPVWFKSTLENTIDQSHGPFAIFLNHDDSVFATTFSRQILCSSSILNIFANYKCILWPWDITYPLNKQRLLERSGRARSILVECVSYFANVDSYPLLLILSRQKDRIVLLDTVNGNCDIDETRACLERTLNPVLEQSIISINETTSLSPGWVGGRTAGNIRRRPSFITTFRLSRPLRDAQRPRYVSFYKPIEDTPEIIVTMQEVKQWLDTKNNNSFTRNQTLLKHQHCDQTDMLLSKRLSSPIPSLSLTINDQYPLVHMSPRRAGWCPSFNR